MISLRPLIGLIKKEIIQVLRDRNMIRIIFAVPIVQLLLFGYVANLEVKNIRLDIYDFDRSVESRELINSAGANDYFLIQKESSSILDLESNFKKSSSDMAIIIPEDFSKRIKRGDNPSVSLISDGSDANSTAIGSGYMAQIIRKFTKDYYQLDPPLKLDVDNRYNPEMESVYFMVPGIVATLLTMITVMLTSMAIVREREIGTLEQLVVTPISETTLLLGKIIPFAFLGILEMSFALVFGVLWFDIPFVGSPILLFGLVGLYLLTTLGIGLFFSNVTTTQQQAMFFAWFFSVFAILTSGFFTPIVNMPQWMQYITYINPMRYFMEIVRGIMLKGAGAPELISQIIILALIGIVIFTFSSIRFSKRIA
jgi:ABC-2 type transport system permease protein